MPQNYRKKKHHKKKHDKNNNPKSPTPNSQQESSSDDEHNENCTHILNYDIKMSEVMGRYLVAARDLKPGELIISELPLAVGPCADSSPVCLGCYQPIEYPFLDSQYKCSECKWPLCSSECPGIKSENGHNDIECKLFKENFHIAELLYDCKGKDIRLLYEVILPLRCLLLKTSNTTKWQNIMKMEAHNDIRRKIPSLWGRNQEVIVNRLKNSWNIKAFTDEEIHTICGVIEVNCFEIGQLGSKARAIYPSAFLLSHDCSPNTTHTDHPITHAMTIRLTRPLLKSEAITLSYAYTFQGTLRRREHLQEGKFFWCQCARCKDPTELGTYTGAMICPKCKDGMILATDPLNQQAPWSCKSCKYSVSAQSMYILLEKIFKEMDSIEPHNIVEHEEFLKKYRNVLTKDHYLCISAKYSLCQLYGRTENFLIHEMSLENLKRKEEYCRDVLRIVNILEPGLSRLRGVIMYELHAPIMIQSTRHFEAKRITQTELRKNLREVVQLLKESLKILSIEPEGSNEHSMAMAAKDAIKRIGTV